MVGLRTIQRKGEWLTAGLAFAAAWLATPSSTRDFGLDATRVAPGQVRISWDRGAPALRASPAVLEIRDGDSRFEIPLSVGQMLDGSITYAQRTPAIAVSLRLEGSRSTAPAQATVTVAGTPVHFAVRTPTLAPPSAPAREIELPPVRAAEPLVREEPRESPNAGDASRVIAKRALALPTVTPAAPRRDITLPEPPSFSARMAAPSVATDLGLTLPKPSAAPPPALTQGPRSGRLIWTGTLGRRGVVEIEGGRATVGSLEGELPGVKVTLRISPAEFVDGGLVVYTADRSQARRTEPASKNNGWNTARFEWDPPRAGQIVVLEAPNASNDFKRLALRSDLKSCSVLLVDWSVPQAPQ